jgi:phosphatidate phosphatase APP1
MVDWVRLGADAEELATNALRGGKRLGGVLRPMMIQPYRGFVADGVAHVRARVLEKPRFEAAADGLRIDASIYANLMRWVVLDMPGVEVTVSMGAASTVATSDSDGFVVARLPVGGLDPGWHAVSFAATDQEGRPVSAAGRVVQPDPASQLAVISDIDDTILRTGMTEGLRSIRRTLLRDAHGRKPIPGTPSLYRGLARGMGGRPESTFFYVSSSPWNLYDMLVQFLQMRGFPRGPLFLTDWRPGPLSSGAGTENPGHKRARIRRLIDSYPELTFLLIGDDGEADPVIYQEFLRSDRDRVRAALVRSVTGEAGRRARRVNRVPPNPNKTLTCSDAEHMARVAHRLGLVDELTVEEVQTEMGARL